MCKKFRSKLKELSMNIPLVEELKQMKSYGKFLKDLVRKKWMATFESADNIHHCSSINFLSSVDKKKDHKAFTILCTIRSFNFSQALRDLGARINLVMLVVYK